MLIGPSNPFDERLGKEKKESLEERRISCTLFTSYRRKIDWSRYRQTGFCYIGNLKKTTPSRISYFQDDVVEAKQGVNGCMNLDGTSCKFTIFCSHVNSTIFQPKDNRKMKKNAVKSTSKSLYLNLLLSQAGNPSKS